MVGTALKQDRKPLRLTVSALFWSVQFFLITNAAVWLEGWYDRDLGGLWQSYVAGIPFFRATLVSDLLYTAAFFGAYEIAKQAQAEDRTMAVRQDLQ
jgi:hypothetical protein